ncbi:MAG: porin [Paracoccaceae bacterium]|nr:MAG: porin [Paracoccaceae bacterium]
MKKILLATSALVLSAGVAAADFSIGGSARAGIVYSDPVGAGESKATVNMRLRFNFDASKELDSGVTLGGRIRMQYDQSRINDTDDIFGDRSGATLSAAYLYAETGGLYVQIGNVDTALDSMALLYNSELGYIGSTFGSYAFANYAAYETSPYGADQINRMGVFASYTVGDLTARLSYVTPNQNVRALPAGVEDEVSISFDYTAGQFSIGVGASFNGGFEDGNDVYAITGEYAINDDTAIGLHYMDNGSANSATTTLYGRTKLANGLGLGAYIAGNDDNTLAKDFAIGIGFDYDLGGATLAGTIQRGFSDETYADLGIRFSF